MYLRWRKKKVSFPYIYNYCIYLPDSVSVSEHLNTLFVKTVRDIGRKFGEGTEKDPRTLNWWETATTG